MKNSINRFNLRVYGIYINSEMNLLVSDEIIKGRLVTKFPGGGLEFGEGTIDCLKREWLEETGCSIEVLSHFYTTDFFQASAFGNNSQVISIYYLVQPILANSLNTKTQPFDFNEIKDNTEVFRFIPLHSLKVNDFTFPIDQKVATMLLEKYKPNN
jgi:ADP-ribose pyrophosphatase YjhB (NUDIX family)